MSDLHTLHLLAVDPSKRALAIRAVKAMLTQVGKLDENEVWTASEKAVYAVLQGAGPQGLVHAEEAICRAAIETFQAAIGDTGAAHIAIDLEHTHSDAQRPPEASEMFSAVDMSRRGIELQFVAPTPPDFDPSYQAARAALVLMSAFDGKPVVAWYYAKSLGCATEDVDLWVEVGNLIAETFNLQKGEAGGE